MFCSSAWVNEKYYHLPYHTRKYRVNDVIGAGEVFGFGEAGFYFLRGSAKSLGR